MDFSLSEEQVLLRDSVLKYAADHGGVERHRQLMRSETGFDPNAWQQIADLGWLCLPFSEDQGGLGGSAVDMMVLFEGLGGALVREPLLHTLAVCGALLREAASAEQLARYLAPLMEGSRQWAFAFAEEGSGYELANIATVAKQHQDGYQLSGIKIAVLNGHCADELLVTALLGNELAVFAVEAGLAGIRREPFTAVDGSRGAVIHLDGVTLGEECRLSGDADVQAAIERALDQAALAMGAEALGAMQKLLDTTVEYTRTREQFGQPISNFQALQHRMADMYLGLEEVRSLVLNAAICLDEGSPEAAAACSALRVKLAQVGRSVSHEAVQLHGGIGMTDELIVGHLFKRLLVLSKLFGDGDYHLQRYTRLRREAA